MESVADIRCRGSSTDDRNDSQSTESMLIQPRHVGLIAEFTRSGSSVAMNRIGMNENPSPYLQMSVETTCSFC